MLSLESKCGRFRLLERSYGATAWNDSRAVEARSFCLFLLVLRSSRIFRLIASPAGIALERIDESIAVRGAMDRPLAAPMVKEITLAAADLREAIDPGQQAGVLERGDRHADRVAVTLRGLGDSLIAREAAPAAIGTVKAPQERAQHPEARPGQRTLVLPRLPIRAVVGVRRGPQAGLGVTVEAVRWGGAENFLPARPQMTRQNKLLCGPFRPQLDAPRRSAENHRLTAGLIFGEPQSCHGLSFPGQTGCKARPPGGLLYFWASAPEGYDDRRACRHWRRRHCACGRTAGTLMIPPAHCSQ